MMKKIIIAALAVVAMAGCTKEKDFNSYSSSDSTVNFSSQSITRTSTNDDGDYIWLSSDKIGIFSDGFVNDYYNVAYQAEDDKSTTTTFSVVEGQTQILYPNVASGSVDFYAYYPYDAAAIEQTKSVDISDQSDLSAIDFMTASATGNSYGSSEETPDPDVDFSFDHMLSQVIFEISPKENITSFEALTARLESIETCGDYYTYGTSQGMLSGSLTSVGSVDLAVAVAEDKKSATVTAILHPGKYSSATLVFELGGTEYSVAFVTELEPSYSHTFNLALGNDITGFESGSTISEWNPITKDTLYPNIVDIAYNSVDDIYEIYTAQGLKAFADLVNGTVNTAAYTSGGITFSTTSQGSIDGKLMNNINLSSVCYAVDGGADVSWIPIGDSSVGVKYEGDFDGNGFEVYNLYINSIDNDLRALFGYISGATITDLGVSGSVTNGGSPINTAGGVVGYASSSSISGCYNNATVKGDEYVGGVVGVAENNSSIIGCYNTGDVECSGDYVGGVVGLAYSSTITSCYSAGVVSGSSSYVGGVLGSNYDDSSTITYCYYDADVTGAIGAINGSDDDINSVKGLSTSEMTNGTLYGYLNSALADTWTDVTNSYPILTWQVE